MGYCSKCGYANFCAPQSSKKLERELQMRGLLGYDDPEPGFEGYGSSADDEIELMVMLSGMVSGQQFHLDTE